MKHGLTADVHPVHGLQGQGLRPELELGLEPAPAVVVVADNLPDVPAGLGSGSAAAELELPQEGEESLKV